LSPTDLERLCSEFDDLVGIKTADGDARWYRQMIPVFERVSVFVPGHHLATGLANGAKGAYSNIACLNPAGAVHWGARSAIDPEWGLDVERAVAAFMSDAIAPLQQRGYSSPTLDKTLAAAGGYLPHVRRVRWPHSNATAAEVQRVRDSAHRLLPPFLRPRED
jgi:dihydrodipicolinate synthase/N-acetylneuraminate lyase